MRRPPKEIAVTWCGPCDLITFADHVNREDAIPHRFCSHCGGSLAVAVYRHARELTSQPPPAAPTATP